MTRHWIFVLLPFSDFNRGNVPEILKKARTIGRWKIGFKTTHRNELSKGDKIVFYLAGEEGKRFLGIGELYSALKKDEQTNQHYVEIGRLKFWRKQPRIADLVDGLSFVKDKKHYGLFFQGGVVAITEKDFETIARKAK